MVSKHLCGLAGIMLAQNKDSSWGLKVDFYRGPEASIGEGNGNPLQCSCLENPRDGGAWWAAVYRSPESRTESDTTEAT